MKKIFALLVTLSLLLGLLSGCGSTGVSTQSNSSAEQESEVAEISEETPEQAPEQASAEPPTEPEASLEEPSAQEPEDPESWDPLAILSQVDTESNPVQFPLAETETLTVWMSIPDMLIMDLPDGMPAVRPFMAMEDASNVHLEWTQVTAQLASTQFPLMVAGGDYTDMMVNVADMYTTGLDAAVEDDVFLALNDYLEEYAPNYYALVNANEETQKECSTSGGNYVAMYGFSDLSAQVKNGLVIRQDFLDQVGLDIPVTYDDYHDVLTAFKNELGVSEPMYLPCSGFFSNEYLVGGYGVAGKVSSVPSQSDPWYQVDGQVRLGAVQPEFQEYLTMMHQWYEEGLVASDFISRNQYDSDQNKNASDDVGLFFLEIEMGWPTLQNLEKTSDTWAITPIAEPVQNAGDIVHFANEASLTDGGGIVISTQCRDVGLAVAWCDNWFSEAGQLAANYGLEGGSYTLENGEPIFTELALTGNNLNVMYSATVVPTIYYRDKLAYTYSDFEVQCYDVWTASRDDAYTYSSNAILTAEENEEYAAIMSDIHTYMEEHITKFITGDVPLDEFDDYVAAIEGMGLDRATALKQAALDRYNA
jgi:putative aldouronate transport system substrate-binding protein